MKCTACNYGRLIPAFLDDLFRCHTCDRCKGNLVYLADYLAWKDDNEEIVINKDEVSIIEISETEKAMICPISGGLMTKFKISNDTEHRLDLSPTTNAIWLDKGEWALLKKSGLAMQLNSIFTSHWQQQIRSNQSREIMASLYERKFGEYYAQIKDFRSMLGKFERRAEVISYLMADDPYKP